MNTQLSAFVTAAGQDRFGKVTTLGPDQNLVKVSASDTDQRLSMFEWIGRTPGGPPLHVHADQDEIFFVLEGEYVFQCGQERRRMSAGDTIFLPRRVHHTFCQLTASGRLLFMFTPAGDMEAFFKAAAATPGPPSAEQADKLFGAHGMQVVGPPIQPD